MTTRRYCVMLIPVAHRAAANLAVGLLFGDDPAVSKSFSRGANADGSYNTEANLYELATHFFGGLEVTEAGLNALSSLSTSVIEPPGGWPWNGISEADAFAAGEALHLEVTITQDGSTPSSMATLAKALDLKGLVPIIPPEV